MFYKVVEGLVPAIAPEDYLKEIRNTRKRKAKQYVLRRKPRVQHRALDRWTLISPCLPRWYIFSGLVTMYHYRKEGNIYD
jgi:hypothetical protein